MENISVNQTETSAFQLPFIVEPAAVRITRLCVESAIALFGLAWNVLVCFILLRQPKKTFIAFYIVNLAFADIGILTLNFPLAVVKEQSPFHWPLGKSVCVFFYPMTEVFYGASVWSITAIAIERHRTINNSRSFLCARNSAPYKPLKYVKWVILVVWVLSFLVVALPLFFVMEYEHTARGTFCFVKWSDAMHYCYVLSLTVLLYLLPLIIITITYVQISKQLLQSSQFHQSLRSPHCCASTRRQEKSRRLKENATTKKFLTPIVLTFLITMLPLNLLRLTVLFWPEISLNKYFVLLYNITVTCVIINSAANPLIYSIVSKEFRKDLKKVSTRRPRRWFTLPQQEESMQLVVKALIIPDQAPIIPDQAPTVPDQAPTVPDQVPTIPERVPNTDEAQTISNESSIVPD